MIAGKLILPGLVVAFVLSTILWALAALHFYWGAGGIWPAKDEQSLARKVVGAPGIKIMPPPLACVSVAALLASLGILPLLLVGVLPAFLPQGMIHFAGLGATLVFMARGYAAWRPEFRKFFPEEPFATLDRRYYAPLCLVIGIGFAFLMIAG
jgi:hypothetical protein